MKVIKRNKTQEDFDINKITNSVKKAYRASRKRLTKDVIDKLKSINWNEISKNKETISIETIQDEIQEFLMVMNPEVAKNFVIYRNNRKRIREFVKEKQEFINQYKKSDNTANATVDDNSNVGNKNIGVLNAEIHKSDNIQINRGMVMDKLKELFPDFNHKQYIDDLESHIIYKHDESTFSGAVAPYCCSISMYPFLLSGLKELGGLSAAPKNLDSFCGMYCNLIFTLSGQFAGAIATSEFLVYFDYFARKEWGDNYYKKYNKRITPLFARRKKTIQSQIHQYFQEVLYTINQPSGARGQQSAFVNFSIFDKAFFDGMFGEFKFPDMTAPKWESVQWLQEEFLHWFNEERMKCILTFPVVSVAMVTKDGAFADERMYKFVCKELSEGNSFFIYLSDTVDSLSSCCRLKNKIQTKEFNFTNGNMGVMTGSKSVITINLNRIVQDCYKQYFDKYTEEGKADDVNWMVLGLKLIHYIRFILTRVYKYHIAYNELLWDLYNAKLLPAYTAGFIDLDKQYLTVGINGLNQAAEFLGLRCNNNKDYNKFCRFIFTIIKQFNSIHNGRFNNHKITFNTECVPAESLAIKNYNWDKADGYWIPEDTNLYASYIYKPNDESLSVLEKLDMHGGRYISEYLDGGAAAHINLAEHLTEKNYEELLTFASGVGCQYFTFNVPNAECDDCGFITKVPIAKCPNCGSEKISYYDRIIGYLTKIKNWSAGRQIEQKTRVYHKIS